MGSKMTRRQFLGFAGMGAAVVGLGLAGCGSDQGGSGSDTGGERKRIAVVCSSAGQNDGGFNQRAVEAANAAAEKYGWEAKVVEPTNGIAQALESMAEDGCNLIFNMEYDFEALINGVGGAQPLAEQYPDVTWVVFNDNPNKNDDGSTKFSNVYSVLFNVNEGAFLAGALSVLVNENSATLFGDGYNFTAPNAGGRALGFIGGTNSNGITVQSYSFIQGANYEAEKLGVTYDYYAKYDAGFSDSATGSTVAGTYYGRGANIVFGCAGSVGDGIMSKAKEAGKLVIQVDDDKDAQQPGYVLTSVLKKTAVPVESICSAFYDGKLGDEENVLNYAVSTGATGITDLATISGSISADGASKWNEIKAEVKDLEGKIGTEIEVVNAQLGEEFDPASCPNVSIK